MGKYFFDQYTYLHFASGITAYFWGLSLLEWMAFHLVFELIENSKWGIHFINHYLWFWPGGKDSSDTLENIVGDNVGALLGWVSAYIIDCFATQNGWNKGRSCRKDTAELKRLLSKIFTKKANIKN